MNAPRPAAYEFDGFRVDPVRRLLSGPDGPIALTPRVFQTLLYLIEHSGELCDKRTLIATVWPDLVVEENNLNQNISTLRRVLGERPLEHRFIVTEPGRGYRFVARVKTALEGADVPEQIAAAGVALDAETTPVATGLVDNPESVAEAAPLPRKPTLVVEASRNRRIGYVVAGSLALAIGLFAFGSYIVDRIGEPSETFAARSVPAEAGEPRAAADGARQNDRASADAPRSIAVLPFRNLSSDAEQEYFADGLTEELLNSLAQIRELRVKARTSSFAFKGSSRTAKEIADALGVDHVLEGSVRKAGNTLRITAQLILAEDQSNLWSGTYDRELEDIFEIQKDIAVAVAGSLSASLGLTAGGGILGGTENLEAYELYLAALQVARSRGGAEVATSQRALALIDSAIELDPRFARAISLKAQLHSGLVQVTSSARIVEEQSAAERAALRAIDLEPSSGNAHAQLGFTLSQRQRWIEAERAYRRAEELGVDIRGGYGVMLIATGQFSKARESYLLWRETDPLDAIMRAMLVLSQLLDGAEEEAFAEYERGKAIYGDWVMADRFMLWQRLASGEIDSPDEIDVPGPISAAARAHFDAPDEALAALHDLYAEDANDNISARKEIAAWAAHFGDPHFAFEVMRAVIASNSQNFYSFWPPVMAPVRQLPEFKSLVREVGLPEYWNEFGWPEICRQVGGDDFECD